jgi:chemotaxis protein CheX
MDVGYINPFINSLYKSMESRIGVSPDRQSPYLKEGTKARGDVSAIIGYAAGDMVGLVVLTFPRATALQIYQLMKGEVILSISEGVQDIVGELVNSVTNGAKEEFSHMEIEYRLSIPTVVIGRNHATAHKGSAPVVVIPFNLGEFPFYMEVSQNFISPEKETQPALAESA